MGVFEFRSDTFTRPTPAMRDAMRDAEVGDDVWGEDPTVRELEELAAGMLGKEAGLFVPSGTFGNQCAVAVHVRPGDELIVSERAHVIAHEAGAAAALGGAQTRTVTPCAAPWITADEVACRLRLDNDAHHPRTALIVLENALSDGSAMPLDEMERIWSLARRHRVAVHLDGARIFNAALALAVGAERIAAFADSVSFCLSKGLGAPVGSVLVGEREFIRLAHRRRKLMGGGMRQAGVLAAPGIIALREGPALLERDHENARLLAALLDALPGCDVASELVQTNMVYCRLPGGDEAEQRLVDWLTPRGFLTHAISGLGLRFVLSREVDERAVRLLAEAIGEYLAAH